MKVWEDNILLYFISTGKVKITNMKNIVKPIAVLIVLIGMVGIAAADPCPDPQTWNNQVPESSLIQVFHEPVLGSTDSYKFMIMGTFTGAEFKELCVADTNGFAQKWRAITTIPSLWQGDILQHMQGPNPTGRFFVQWKTPIGAGGGGNNFLDLDESLHNIGTATFTDASWENSLTTLVHVIGSDFCESKYPGQNKDSCYVRPQPPSQLVPELSPMILTSAGLLGIVLISRKYRNK